MVETDYPYKGEMEIFSPSCKYDATKGGVSLADYTMVQAGDADCTKKAIENGPVIVSVQASSWHFKLYSGGIIGSGGCGTEVDHSLLAVGYGSVDGTKAYIEMKNSWGTKWGNNGFVKIRTNTFVSGDDGVCGINKVPISITTN